MLCKPYHLVTDEPVTVGLNRKDITCRLRIWRTRNWPAVVLVSPIGDHQPGVATTKFADLVYESHLHYVPGGMKYHEFDGADLYQITFRPIGNLRRMRHADPQARLYPRRDFAAIIGNPVTMEMEAA